MIVPLVLWLIALMMIVLLLLRVWSPRVLRAHSRLVLITTAVEAVVLLLAVRALAAPPGAFSYLWTTAAVVTGAGIASVVVSWRTLPWATEKPKDAGDERRRTRRSRTSQALAGCYLLIGAGLAVLLV